MSNISIERLEELSGILKSWLDGYCPHDDKVQYTTIYDAIGAIRELMEFRSAAPVGITDRSEIECLGRGEMANVMPPDYKGVDKGDEVFIYATPHLSHKVS